MGNVCINNISHYIVVMHKPTLEWERTVNECKILCCFSVEKEAWEFEELFFKKLPRMSREKTKGKKRESAFCMWFMPKNTHAAHHIDLKRQKCCSKTLPERESMGTKPQGTKSPWIIHSSELICGANINTISADPWVSLFSRYTEFFEGWKLVTAVSRSELGGKKRLRKT